MFRVRCARTRDIEDSVARLMHSRDAYPTAFLPCTLTEGIRLRSRALARFRVDAFIQFFAANSSVAFDSLLGVPWDFLHGLLVVVC